MLILFFACFVVVILALIAVDLGVIGRKAHVISVREALLRTIGWFALAMLFNVFIYFLYGHNWLGWSDTYTHELSGRDAAIQFFTGYLLEQSLSVDNMFVIATIFAYFHVAPRNQHRVLFWGILGALILRGIMIALGATLISRFEWMTYVFGGLLILTAAKMLFTRAEAIHPDRNLVVRIARKLWPVSTDVEGMHFFVPVTNPNGKSRKAITPLFLALLLVETSDVMFAVDSIPAIFAVTKDPFIVYTSNVFAICGLRSLFFALAGLMDKFHRLQSSLVVLLAYIGVKMLLAEYVDIPQEWSLAIIGGILAVGVVASLIAPPRGKTPGAPTASDLEPDEREDQKMEFP
jgi:tellurite resistance protein TerC